MRTCSVLLVAATMLVTIPGCSPSRDASPGSVTADEAAQLNDAAEMLDANSTAPVTVGADEQPTKNEDVMP